MMKPNLINMIFWVMIMLILMMISINLNNHPIFIMILIIIYSTLICLNLSMWKMNFIYSIMLFLIMISGLLIIFLYFSSLISNEQMNFTLNLLTLPMLINLFLMMLLIYLNKMYFNNLIYSPLDLNSLNKINNKLYENILNIYMYPFNNITICSMLYLLISLFIIIKICNLKIKPLRKIS